MKESLVILFLIGWITGGYAATAPSKPIWNATWTDLLKRDLLMNYDKFARPMQHFNTTTIKLHLTIRHIDLDDMKAIMTVFGWISMEWQDSKLKWDPADYGSLKKLHLAEHEIWQPDVVLYNSATGSTMDHYGNSHCIVSNEGEVLWVPPSQFLVFCELNLKYWPFDTQTCSLILGSWTYDGTQIDFNITKENGAHSERIVENHEWEIIELKTKRSSTMYACCVEPYVDVTYEITIKRRSPMYKAVVITPASVIILMTLAGFWLPALSGEKIILNGLLAVIICMFLMYFAQMLPVMALHTPLVVLFYSSSLYLVCFSTIVSIIVLGIARSRQAFAVPRAIKLLLDGFCGSFLMLKYLHVQPNIQRQSEELRDPPFDENNTSDDHNMIHPASKATHQQDWIILATAIDRVVFLIYCFIFIVLAAACSV